MKYKPLKDMIVGTENWAFVTALLAPPAKLEQNNLICDSFVAISAPKDPLVAYSSVTFKPEKIPKSALDNWELDETNGKP